MNALKHSFLFGSLLVIMSCTAPKKQTVVATEAIKKTTDSILNNWHLAATQANFDPYFNAMDSIAVFIGTAASENWTKAQFSAYSKPYFDQGEAWDFKTLERNIYVHKSGDLVWFDELLNTWMGTCRGSGVLEKVGDTYAIKHYVLSVTIPNEDIQKVIDIKQKNDAEFLAKFN